MADDEVRAEIRRAVRALESVATMLAEPRAELSHPALDAMSAVELARTARAHTDRVVALLTGEALARGATYHGLDFFRDLYD